MKSIRLVKPLIAILGIAAVSVLYRAAAAQDLLQLPALSQNDPNLLKAFSSLSKTFQIGSVTTSPSQIVDGVFNWDTFDKRLFQSGTSSAFLSFDNVSTMMGPSVDGNLSQSLTIPVSTTDVKAYATKLFLTVGAEGLQSRFDGELVLRIRIHRQDPASGFSYEDEIKLYGGTQIVNRSSGTGLLYKDPVSGYFKKWVGGSQTYYTLAFSLNQNYFYFPIQDIQIVYNDPFPTTSISKPNIHIRGLNIETNIQIQPFTAFTQFDPQWKLSKINGKDPMKNKGCVITSAAMAMRAIGLQKGPDGADITPGSLLTWLNANSGFIGKTSSLKWDALTKFANAAYKNGYNGGKSLSLIPYRIDQDASLDQTKKRNAIEGALAARYPVMLRVASGYKTEDNADNRNAHTVLAYGLIPDYANNVSGTFQINDPGVSSPAPNLWGRIVGNSIWKGKWLHGAVAKPVSGATVLPSTVTLVLHSPGSIYVEGATSKYAVGYNYLNQHPFTNTFPNNIATYQFLNPDEDFEPGVDNDPYPPAAEAVQVVTIKNRPNEALNVTVTGTGTGAFTLTLDEEVWTNQNLQSVYSNVVTGNLTPGATVNASVPASGYGATPPTPTSPVVYWTFSNTDRSIWVSGAVQSAGAPLPYYNPLGGMIFPVGIKLNLSGQDNTPGMASQSADCALQSPLEDYPFTATRWGSDDIESDLTFTKPGVYGCQLKSLDNIGIGTYMNFAVHIGQYVTITGQPISDTKVEGQHVSFAVCAPASPAPTFQWYKDGNPIPGATETVYTINSVSPSDFGKYSCLVKQYNGDAFMSQATSNAAQLDVIPANPPQISAASPSNLVLNGICRLSGANFGYNKDAVKVILNGTRIGVDEASGVSISFKVPPNAALGAASVLVEVYGIVSTNTLSTNVVPNMAPIINLLLQ